MGLFCPQFQIVGRKSLTNLRSEMIFPQGKPVFFLYLPTIYTPILTDNPPILLTMDTAVAAKGKVSHVTSSAFWCFRYIESIFLTTQAPVIE